MPTLASAFPLGAVRPAPLVPQAPDTLRRKSARRLLLVDDHELLRLGVQSAIVELDGAPVRWLDAASLEGALALYARTADIDAVLLDLNLGDSKGLHGLRRFLQRFPAARIAVHSGTDDEFVVRQARALGAAAYVPKGATVHALQHALSALLRHPGGRPPEASTQLFPCSPSSALQDRVAELGARQLEILELVLSGCNNQEIGAATGLSLGTVKNTVSSLLLALDVRSRSHLISLFR